MNVIDTALALAIQAHAGQTDRNGEPAILHPLTVGLMGHTDEERATGFLHDVVEDSDLTFENLEDAGIPDGIISALRLLTHTPETSYEDYLEQIILSRHPIALQVKYNDLKHNVERGKDFPDLQAKHVPALKRIEKAIEEVSRVTLYSDSQRSDGCEIAIFACGCFWGVQHLLQKQQGVVRTFVGYIGGKEEFPSYAQVRDHQTGHVEAVLVEYNPQLVSYTDLCKLFFEIHDPAQTDGQGPDLGPQYRSAVFYRSDEQLQQVSAVIGLLRDKGYEVNTLLKPATDFWIGEGYHQDYYELSGGSPYCHIREKKF